MKFLYAAVAALALAGVAAADDFVVIVLDDSGSMSEYMRTAKCSRMECATGAVLGVLSKVPATTNVGILTFSGWAYDLKPVDAAALAEALKKCRPNGGTPLYKYMKVGADRLLEERQRRLNVGSYKLLVVTDGEAQDSGLNDDSGGRPGYLKDIISRGLVVDVIGLEMRKDHALKKLINGTYTRGDDPDSIQQSLAKSVAEVGFAADGATPDEAFKTLEGLPDSFVRDSISGLTQFRNHPIGEAPPAVSAGDGQAAAPGGVSGFACAAFTIALGLATVVIIAAVALRRS